MPSDTSNPPNQEPVIRALMMPRDTNSHGTIFGGVILSLIDQAAGVVAALRSRTRVVTVKMDEVIFRNPVFVGDLVSVYAQVVHVGRTSMRIEAEVYAQRRDLGTTTHVTSAELVFVSIDENHRPMAIPAS